MSGVDPTIVDAIDQAEEATMDPWVVIDGVGKACQAVAASAALAIQDAVDALRHNSTIATSASAMAYAQFLASGDPRYLQALAAIQESMSQATRNFAEIGAAATRIVEAFPPG